MEKFVAVLLSGALNGIIYALIGLGYGLVYRVSGLVNLAHGEIVMLGALLGYEFTVARGHPLAVSIALVAAAGALIGTGTEFLLLRRMRAPSLLKALILTFGLVLVIQAAAREWFGTDTYSIATFPGVPRSFTVGYDRATLPGQSVWILALAIVVLVGTVLLLGRSRIGLGIRAVGSDAEVAEAYGVGARRINLVTFGLTGAIAAVSGLFIAPVVFMTYLGGTFLGLKGLVAAIVGGLRRPLGAVAGGLLLGLAENFTAGYGDAGWQNATAFLLLIVVLLWRPAGLLERRAS